MGTAPPYFGVVPVRGRLALASDVFLTGQLACQDHGEITIVAEFPARHIELTRTEPCCISFEVHPTSDPLAWEVSECSQDTGSFELHQARVTSSEWGRATAGIKRGYSVAGL